MRAGPSPVREVLPRAGRREAIPSLCRGCAWCLLRITVTHGRAPTLGNARQRADRVGGLRVQQHRTPDGRTRPDRLRLRDRRFLETPDPAEHRETAVRRFSVFLEIAQVIAGYQIESTVGAGFNATNSSSFGPFAFFGGSALAQGKYTDRPTLIYAPLTGNDFLKKLMTPIRRAPCCSCCSPAMPPI